MRPSRGRYLLPLCALLLVFADARAADIAARALAHAERNHRQAVAAVAEAQSHVKNIESELQIARTIEGDARRSGDKAALTVAYEAVAESKTALEEARRLLMRARALAARRGRAVESLRTSLRPADRQAAFVVADGGDVRRFAADGTPIAEDAGPLRAGEIIRTGPGAGARLFLAGELGQVQLAPDTEFILDEDGLSGEGLARLTAGRLRALVKKLMAKERFEVRTPAMVCAVRGTDFDVDTTGGGMRVRVFSGQVDVMPTGSDEAIEVTSGQQWTSGSDAPEPFDVNAFPVPWENPHEAP